jgi:hypothetical protein
VGRTDGASVPELDAAICLIILVEKLEGISKISETSSVSRLTVREKKSNRFWECKWRNESKRDQP